MHTFAFALPIFFVIGYFVLAGADIGVGMLLPFLGRDRRLTIAAIAPFFLGNEVWLVGSAGLFSGLFPGMEGEVFGRTWGALVALVAGWIVRDMGLWLRGRQDGATWRAFWDGATVAGSWTVAVSWGVTVGLLMGGGGAALFAVPACALFALHGAVFAILRLGGDAPRRAARAVVRVAVLAGVPCAIGAGVDRLAVTAGIAAGLLAVLAVAWLALNRAQHAWALAASATAIVAVPLLGGLNLPDATPAANASLTLTIIAPALPLMLAAQAWVWWTFRGRVTKPSYL